jgi:hypothetical protein
MTWDLQRRRGLEMNELRQLFVQRLSTIDDRFPDASESEREFIKSKLRRMLFSIDDGMLNLPQLADPN